MCREVLIKLNYILPMKIELTCKNCDKLFTTDFKHRDKQFCNRSCYFEFARKNNLLGREKDQSIRETRKCLQCGVEFVERKKHKKNICSDECRGLWSSNKDNIKKRIEKSKKVLLEKYGYDSIFKIDSFREGLKQIFQKKYGVDHPMGCKVIVDKLKNTVKENHILHLLTRLKNHNIILLDDYKTNKNGNTTYPYNFQCNVCNNVFSSTLLGSGKIPLCRKCYPITKNSKLETIIKDFLNEKNIKHLDNDRKLLNGKEIDIFLPDYNLGIELNGNYFHSEVSGNKDKYYHLNKMILASSKNLKLLHFFEDEIILKKEIVFSRLSNLLNLNRVIYGRNCLIKEVLKKESSDFLNKNHLQGNSVDKIRYGLYHNGILVSIMTFGKKRKSLGHNKSGVDDYELVRFCNILNHNIVGGFSKLLNFFIKTHSPRVIETYADIRWSGLNPISTVYSKNGFVFKKQTPPNYWYIKNGDSLHRSHRFTFRKNVLVQEGYSKEKTEWEIMKEKGYDRIWDCGSMKFELIPVK